MKSCHTCQHTYSDDLTFCPRDGARLTADAMDTQARLTLVLSGRYRMIRRLGAGGMGTVFLAEQIGVGNRHVALKILSRKLLDDPEFLLRFQNEAASTGRICHENVLTIYDSAQADDGTPYIAMEFLDGDTLRQALQRRGALPVGEVADILQQAARGLNAAHELGIIHRDLKPDNIFLTRDREGRLKVKLVDFGIAKLLDSATLTVTGMVLGTPAYMSCEQAYGMRSDELDARSDIYSLGVVVYEMLTGRVPFHSDTPAGYLRQHLMEEPPPFRAIAPALGVPPAVESAVMKALVKDRTQRYDSALDFARAFLAAAQPLPRAKSRAATAASTNLESPQPQGGALSSPEWEVAGDPTGQEVMDPTPAPRPPAPLPERFPSPSGPADLQWMEMTGPFAGQQSVETGGKKSLASLPVVATAGAFILITMAFWFFERTSPEFASKPALTKMEESKRIQPLAFPHLINPLTVPQQGGQRAVQYVAAFPYSNSPTKTPSTPGGPNLMNPVQALPNNPAAGSNPQGVTGADEPAAADRVIYKVGGDVSAPIPAFTPDPPYTQAAKAAKLQGTAVLWVVVGAQGSVTDVRIRKPLGLGLDQSAVETVKTWKFSPALRKGTAVPVWTLLEVNFRLP